MANPPVQVVWFKRDLRTHDHSPLAKACAAGKVLPLYVIEPGLWREPDSAQRHWDFIAESLGDLCDELAALGLPLCVVEGEITDVLALVAMALGPIELHSHQETGNDWTFARDRRVAGWCREHRVAWHQARQQGVVRGLGQRRGWVAQWEALVQAPIASPSPASPPAGWKGLPGLPREQWKQRVLGVGREACPGRQAGGRSAGLATWRSFLAGRGERFHRDIGSPERARNAGSRLSPHLAWGTLSLREVVQELRLARSERRGEAEWGRALAALESRLHWHCHFIQKLESQPDLEHQTMHPALRGLREHPHPERLTAWCEGRTGVPLVDAGMVALRETGWLNFRMRAMLVSFATFGLGLPWREPALHLARLFVDYEPGIHYPQVQMQAGLTGTNAMRVYNPLKQADERDPQGRFVMRWLPALTGLPEAWRQRPWALPAAERTALGFVPGRDYPLPVHDFEAEARRWKRIIHEARQTPEARRDSDVLLERLSSRRGTRRPAPPPSPQLSLFSEPDQETP
ncbi:MAG: deoxyribodipyrimidine photo-lyase/cryptochrome family protein [Halomonas sp.]